jgi:hypothetical protein
MDMKKAKAKINKNELLFVEALRDLSKKFRADEVVISVKIGRNGLELLNCCDLEGNMIFDGEIDMKKEKPNYFG